MKLRVFFFVLCICSCLPAFAQEEQIKDPLEPFNRGVYWFNETADEYVIDHVAASYDYIVPDELQSGIGNVFSNLRYPKRLVSNVVMGDFEQAGVETLRFLLNSTLGIVGFFDVAKKLGLEEKERDMGVAFAYYDIPAGPYLVLPLLGPSNV
ncbi:MAG: VacJ family lipoprotein, partial [Bdellovibrionales bacterium]|nr:VacJ family lipoprotein [Bdellovibrionales bacterium]